MKGELVVVAVVVVAAVVVGPLGEEGGRKLGEVRSSVGIAVGIRSTVVEERIGKDRNIAVDPSEGGSTSC